MVCRVTGLVCDGKSFARRRNRAGGPRGVAAAFGAAAVLLAGCGGDIGLPARTGLTDFVRGNTETPEVVDPTETVGDPTGGAGVCPRVSIRPQTEVLRRGAGSEASDLNWQASITRTARECAPAEGGLTLRVGLSGRVVEGPRGAPSVVRLPVRVAVSEGGSVTYSQLHNVDVTLDEPSVSWAFVDETVPVTDARRAVVIVGFDG